jgi:NAD(P)H-nitrite reductase large subunit
VSSKVLVCRCEDVTLHELEEAISRGHSDVESLKRYTGFGTGWCQGKGCLAVCARILAQRGGDAANPFTPRPPFHPVTLSHLAAIDESKSDDDEG